ncbi:MAG: hypothetical protein EOO01_02980 [Chitinophagaceae bacterium]|nr:MAG: hypothetical protein EOO01_02980 [Chitinophagaceae bacterium]
MKKYMIPVAAMLLFAGVAGAQTTPAKHPSKTAPAKKEMAAKKSTAADKSTASVASAGKAGTDASATAVNRKHHHKKAKPSTKTESK